LADNFLTDTTEDRMAFIPNIAPLSQGLDKHLGLGTTIKALLDEKETASLAGKMKRIRQMTLAGQVDAMRVGFREYSGVKSVGETIEKDRLIMLGRSVNPLKEFPSRVAKDLSSPAELRKIAEACNPSITDCTTIKTDQQHEQVARYETRSSFLHYLRAQENSAASQRNLETAANSTVELINLVKATAEEAKITKRLSKISISLALLALIYTAVVDYVKVVKDSPVPALSSKSSRTGFEPGRQSLSPNRSIAGIGK
jgi:hypothetical protein